MISLFIEKPYGLTVRLFYLVDGFLYRFRRPETFRFSKRNISSLINPLNGRIKNQYMPNRRLPEGVKQCTRVSVLTRHSFPANPNDRDYKTIKAG
jgi:hypothetical protein